MSIADPAVRISLDYRDETFVNVLKNIKIMPSNCNSFNVLSADAKFEIIPD